MNCECGAKISKKSQSNFCVKCRDTIMKERERRMRELPWYLDTQETLYMKAKKMRRGEPHIGNRRIMPKYTSSK